MFRIAAARLRPLYRAKGDSTAVIDPSRIVYQGVNSLFDFSGLDPIRHCLYEGEKQNLSEERKKQLTGLLQCVDYLNSLCKRDVATNGMVSVLGAGFVFCSFMDIDMSYAGGAIGSSALFFGGSLATLYSLPNLALASTRWLKSIQAEKIITSANIQRLESSADLDANVTLNKKFVALKQGFSFFDVGSLIVIPIPIIGIVSHILLEALNANLSSVEGFLAGACIFNCHTFYRCFTRLVDRRHNLETTKVQRLEMIEQYKK